MALWLVMLVVSTELLSGIVKYMVLKYSQITSYEYTDVYMERFLAQAYYVFPTQIWYLRRVCVPQFGGQRCLV